MSPKKDWKSDTYLGFRPTEIDWARLAAFIDGEGSINLSPRRTNSGRTLTLCGKVVVTNTDFRLAEWCLATFGMKFYQHSNNAMQVPTWRPCVYAQASSFRAAWVLRNCLPYFILKREQAEVVLAHQETTTADVFKRGAGVRTPQNVLDMRAELKRRLTELNRRGRKAVVETVTDIAMEA